MWEEELGDVAFADDVETILPRARVIRTGGLYELEGLQQLPSLMSKLALFVDMDLDLSDPSICHLLPRQEVLAFCGHFPDGLEDKLAQLRSYTPYKQLIEAGLLQDLWLNLQFYEEGDAVLKETAFPLPVAELHAPWIDGCEAAYQISESHSGSAFLRVRFLGMGAGGGIGARVSFEDRLWTTAACGRITIPGDIEVVPWHNPDLDRTIEVISVTNVKPGEWSLVEIPGSRVHSCGAELEEQVRILEEQERRNWSTPQSDSMRHKVEVAGGITKKREVQESRRFQFSVGEFVDVTTSFSSGYLCEYKLVSRVDYLGFYESDVSESFFFSWNDLDG